MSERGSMHAWELIQLAYHSAKIASIIALCHSCFLMKNLNIRISEYTLTSGSTLEVRTCKVQHFPVLSTYEDTHVSKTSNK